MSMRLAETKLPDAFQKMWPTPKVPPPEASEKLHMHAHKCINIMLTSTPFSRVDIRWHTAIKCKKFQLSLMYVLPSTKREHVAGGYCIFPPSSKQRLFNRSIKYPISLQLCMDFILISMTFIDNKHQWFIKHFPPLFSSESYKTWLNKSYASRWHPEVCSIFPGPIPSTCWKRLFPMLLALLCCF